MAWLKKEPLKSLRKDLGKDKLLTAPEELLLYGYDATSFRGEPLAVVMVEDTEDIRQAVNFAREEGYKITPRGAGSAPVSGRRGTPRRGRSGRGPPRSPPSARRSAPSDS